MLTHGKDVEAHALRSRGWTISAIARHLGRDRKTVPAYINGERVPGLRAKSSPDPLEDSLRGHQRIQYRLTNGSPFRVVTHLWP